MDNEYIETRVTAMNQYGGPQSTVFNARGAEPIRCRLPPNPISLNASQNSNEATICW
jgi:hypothetical protein